MESLRRRAPFTANESDDELDEKILDEIEQEDLIESLKARNESSTRHSLIMLRTIISLAIFLHILAITQGTNPLDVFLSDPESLESGHPLPLGRYFFPALHVAILADLALRDWTDFSWISMLSPSMRFKATHALVSIAPVLTILSFHSLSNVAWSAFALIIVIIDDFIRTMVRMGKENVDSLERSKYPAKGA